MKAIIFPSLIETIELHTRLIDRFGGQDGVRDMGFLKAH